MHFFMFFFITFFSGHKILFITQFVHHNILMSQKIFIPKICLMKKKKMSSSNFLYPKKNVITIFFDHIIVSKKSSWAQICFCRKVFPTQSFFLKKKLSSLSSVGIGISGKMFKNYFLTSKNSRKFSLTFFGMEILLQLGVLDNQILLHFSVPDNKILLPFCVPDNQILLHFGVPDNCSMNISSKPWLGN